MKLEKLQFYLLIMLLFLFIGCGGEPDKYTIKVEVENENTEWYLTLGEEKTPSLMKGTMVLDLPTSKGFFSSLPMAAKVTLNPADSNGCVKFTVTNESAGSSASTRGCGTFLKIGVKPTKEYPKSLFWGTN